MHFDMSDDKMNDLVDKNTGEKMDKLPHQICLEMPPCGNGFMPNFDTCQCEEVETKFNGDPNNEVCPNMPPCGSDKVPDFEKCMCKDVPTTPQNEVCPNMPQCGEGETPDFV